MCLLFCFWSLHTTCYIFYSLFHIYVFTYFALIVCCGLKFTERRSMPSINSSLLPVLRAPCGHDILVPFLSCCQRRMVVGWAAPVSHSSTNQVCAKAWVPLYGCETLIVTLRKDLAISGRKGDGKFPKRSGGCAGHINRRTSAAFGNGCTWPSSDLVH